MISEEPKIFPRRYEVHFKSSTGVYLYDGDLNIGDFVAVQCGKGYNVGAVYQSIPPDVEIPLKDSSKPQKILNKLTEDKAAIEQMLRNKVLAENNALALCRTFCQSHKIGTTIDAISAEFQFDRKKLTIYVIKSGDTSVCKLVRKLFDTFKMRISILDIESVEVARQFAIRYLQLTQLNLRIQEVFLDPSTFVPPPNLNAKNGLRKSNSFKTHTLANPSLLSALQEYKPSSQSLAHPPPPLYHELAGYRPYSHSQYLPPPAPPRVLSRPDQQPYSFHGNSSLRQRSSSSISRLSGYSREDDIPEPFRVLGQEYVDQDYSSKPYPGENYVYQNYGQLGSFPSEPLPHGADNERFDEAFDTSFRQLMVSYDHNETHPLRNSQSSETNPGNIIQSSRSSNSFLSDMTSPSSSSTSSSYPHF